MTMKALPHTHTETLHSLPAVDSRNSAAVYRSAVPTVAVDVPSVAGHTTAAAAAGITAVLAAATVAEALHLVFLG